MQHNGSGAPGEEPEYEGLDLDTYKSWWREWVDNYGDARRQSLRDEEYYDGDVKGTGEGHWEQAQLKVLSDRKQPPSVFNLIKRKINAIAGVEQRSRSEPRGLPRTPKDQYAAEIATDSLRFVKEQARFPMLSANAFLEALKVGYTACEIGGAKDCVPTEPGDWREYFFDPRSRRFDFSDARFLGWAKWLDKDVAVEAYAPAVPAPQIPPQPEFMPGQDDPFALMEWQAAVAAIVEDYQAAVARRQAIVDRLEATVEGNGSSSLAEADFDDHNAGTFCDPKRKRVFIIDMWHRDARHGWYRCVFTGAGKLFTEAATLIEKDAWGRKRPTHPVKAFSLYVAANGWRYGEVRGMRSPQDEVNARRSKAMHLLTVNQVITRPGNYGPEGDKEKLRAEVARPDGFIEIADPAAFRIEKNVDLAVGQQRLGQEAREFMEMEGPNPQLQGEQGRATSGRAVLALQQAGLGALGPVFDRFHDWEDRCYRAMWARIQQFWTAPMYVRVTDDKNAARFAAVNGAPVLDENGRPKQRQMMMPGMGAPTGMGNGAQPAMLRHNGGPAMDPGEFEGPMLAELDMDIIIDRAPEAATLQAEQFQELVKLAATPAGVAITPEMIITASALPQKAEMLDQLEKGKQAPNPKAEADKAMYMASLKELEAKVEKLIAERDKIRAETARAGASIPQTQAQTAKTEAEARSANVTATMTEVEAGLALDRIDALANFNGMGPQPYSPLAAGVPGAPLGLPPQPANGPPL